MRHLFSVNVILFFCERHFIFLRTSFIFCERHTYFCEAFDACLYVC
jgi:hypothetical protein